MSTLSTVKEQPAAAESGEKPQNHLRKKWNLLENMAADQADENFVIEDDEDESNASPKFEEQKVIMIKNHDDYFNDPKKPAEKINSPSKNEPTSQLMKSSDLEISGSTYQKAISEFGKHDETQQNKNVTFSIDKSNEQSVIQPIPIQENSKTQSPESALKLNQINDSLQTTETKKEQKYESPQVNSRIISQKVDSKIHKSVAYPPTKSGNKKSEPPTTVDTHNITTDPSTNITKQILADQTPSKTMIDSKPVLQHLAGISEDLSKRTPSEKQGISASTSTLQAVSSLSSHASLGQSQAFDSKRALASIKERYKVTENKDPNAMSIAESPNFKASELISKEEQHVPSSEKPVFTDSLKVQQLADSSGQKETSLLKNTQSPGIPNIMGEIQVTDYHDQLKEFLRVYIDNRLPEHMRSYKSPARMFKTRFYQRFYDTGRTPSSLLDEDVQVANYYEHLEHVPKSTLSETRALLYQSQLEDTMRKSERRLNNFNV